MQACILFKRTPTFLKPILEEEEEEEDNLTASNRRIYMYDKETFSPVFKPPMMNFFANTFVQSGKWLPLIDTSTREKEVSRGKRD